MVRAMCGVELKDIKLSTHLIFILVWKETMANSVHWYGHVLRRGWLFHVKSIKRQCLRSKKEREADEDMKKGG